MTTIQVEPDAQQKLTILGGEASDEVTDVPTTDNLKHAIGMLYNAKQEGGGTTSLFKVLQTNACRYACR
jgi:predicted DNA-binding helix-hairpin-helix protein